MKPVLKFYKEGFFLLTQSILLLLISFFISLTMYLFTQAKGSAAALLIVPTLFLVLLFFGYQFSLPKLLVLNQQNKKLHLLTLWNEVWSASKRLLVPVVVTLFLALLVGFVIGFAYFMHLLTISWLPTVLGGLVLTVANTLLVIMPIYFSLENKGVIDSIKLTWKLFLTYPVFFIPVIVWQLLQASTSFLPTNNPAGWVILSLEGSFFQLWLIAAALLFYQSLKPAKSK